MDGELYSKLTSSGKAGLRQVRENFADSVLERAYRIAVKHNTGDSEISLRDIMDAKNEILYNRSLSRYRRLFTISFFLLSVGVVYLVIGYYSLYFRKNTPRAFIGYIRSWNSYDRWRKSIVWLG